MFKQLLYVAEAVITTAMFFGAIFSFMMWRPVREWLDAAFETYTPGPM